MQMKKAVIRKETCDLANSILKANRGQKLGRVCALFLQQIIEALVWAQQCLRLLGEKQNTDPCMHYKRQSKISRG